MFERFTDEARRVVVLAQEEARSFGHPWIGSGHLLLAGSQGDTAAARALREVGLTPDRLRAALREMLSGDAVSDEAALREVGVDLEQVRRRMDQAFGPGWAEQRPGGVSRRTARWWKRRRASRRAGRHIPFTADAKQSLERALREALELRSRVIGAEHVVLAVLRADSDALPVVRRLGADPADVRRAVLAARRGAA